LKSGRLWSDPGNDFTLSSRFSARSAPLDRHLEREIRFLSEVF
jgi:hypothetical protein